MTNKPDHHPTPPWGGLPSVDLLGQFWNQPIDYDTPPHVKGHRPTWSRRILSAIVCLTIGLLLATAYQETQAAQPAELRARDELRSDVVSQTDSNALLSETVDQLREDITRRRDELIGDEEEVNNLHNQEALAGFRAVTGDGTVVTISDGEHDNGRVYDRELQLVVNTMWAHDAEAITIDGQRITATTTIRQAGNTILVGFSPVSSPYRIEAIGPNNLTDNLNDSAIIDTIRGYTQQYGITVSVAAVDDLTLPAAELPTLTNATPEQD